MKTILLFISLLSLTFVYSQRLPLTDLEVKDNVYTLNGTPYTGNIYELYKSGQLKSEYEVRDGQKHGAENIYFINFYFKREDYKDALLMQIWNTSLVNFNNEISQLQKDSSYEYLQLSNIRNNEIGIKKFYKYKEKYNEGKLKNDQLVLYDKYLNSKNKYDQLSDQLKQKHAKRSDVIVKLEKEKNKPIYSNNLKRSYTYLNGSKTGTHKEYENHDLVLEEVLKDGVRNGFYKKYGDGKLIETSTYENDSLNGEYKKYNGEVVIIEGQYSMGLLNGEWIFRYVNGNINKKRNYINGKMEGECVVYDTNGIVLLESVYLDDKLNGPYKKYKGEVVIEEGQYKDGQKSGDWVYRNSNGKILELDSKTYDLYYKVLDNLLYGQSTNNDAFAFSNIRYKKQRTNYDSDGITKGYKLRLNDSPINGIIFDIYDGYLYSTDNYRMYDGNIKFELPVLNGLTHGFRIWYYDNGTIKSVSRYIDGETDGYEENYYKDGNISSIRSKTMADRSYNYWSYYRNGQLKKYKYQTQNGYYSICFTQEGDNDICIEELEKFLATLPAPTSSPTSSSNSQVKGYVYDKKYSNNGNLDMNLTLKCPNNNMPIYGAKTGWYSIKKEGHCKDNRTIKCCQCNDNHLFKPCTIAGYEKYDEF